MSCFFSALQAFLLLLLLGNWLISLDYIIWFFIWCLDFFFFTKHNTFTLIISHITFNTVLSSAKFSIFILFFVTLLMRNMKKNLFLSKWWFHITHLVDHFVFNGQKRYSKWKCITKCFDFDFDWRILHCIEFMRLP